MSQREKWRHLIPTSLLQVTVHPDWEAVERRARARDARLRIVLQLVVIGVGLLGVAWLVVYYVASQYIPFMGILGGWNILIGMGLMTASFGIATQWK